VKKISLLGLLLSLNISHADVTGNVLPQQFFNNNQNHNGWICNDPSHNHGNSVIAAYHGDSIERDVSLSDYLTEDQIKYGWSSTLGADIWHWNNLSSETDMIQTITASDGTVTVQSRTVSFDEVTPYQTYTSTYIENMNSNTDYNINVKFNFRESSESQYHRAVDLKNPTLFIDYEPNPVFLNTAQEEEITSAVSNIDVIDIPEYQTIEEFTVPEMNIELETIEFTELQYSPVAVIEEINTGVIDVFYISSPEEMEIEYDNSQNIEEISTEIQDYQEESFDNQRGNETEQTVAIREDESFTTNEQESGVASNEDSIAGNNTEQGEVITRNESSEQIETSEQVSEESRQSDFGERNESESREDEGTVSETARVGDSEQSLEQDNTETETSVSIDIADIEAQVSERLTSIDAQLVATQTIIANAMTSQSVDSYASKNNNIFIQPSIDGGNIDDYIARDYSDARQLYASAQSPYQDSMVQRKEKIDEAVSNRIRAEEHLRRIRGY
jgi:hypothetical protein